MARSGIAGGYGGVMLAPAELFTCIEWEASAANSRFEASTLAALCGLSLRQLERRFQVQFGQTPVAWMREVRCRKFAARMAQGYLLKQLVPWPELGFKNASQVCQEFRKAFGTTPRAYVRMKYGTAGGGQEAALIGCRF